MESFDTGGHCKAGVIFNPKRQASPSPNLTVLSHRSQSPKLPAERTHFSVCSLPHSGDSLTNPNLLQENRLWDIKNTRLQNQRKENVLQKNSKLILPTILAGSMSQAFTRSSEPHLEPNWTGLHNLIHLLSNRTKDTLENFPGNHCWLL